MRRMLVEAVRNMRIKPKMVLLYSVCILFQLLLFGSILFFIVIEEIRAQAVMGISQNARHINLSLDEYIKEMETISFMSYNNQQLQQHLTDLAENGGGDAAQQLKAREEIEAFLDSVLTVNDNLDYISVICSDGRFYTKSIYGPVRMQEDYLREQMQQLDASRGGITISAAHAAAYDFSPMPTVFSVGRRIMDFESGYYIGYLLLECNLNVFDRIAENTQVGQNGFWTAQAPDGGMLYSTAPEGADLSENAQDDFYIQSDTSADTGIVVRCFLPRQEVTRTARTTILLFVMLLMGTLSFTVLCSNLIARSIDRPIRAIRDGMEKVKNGDFTVQVQPQANDEVGELAQSFNQLTQRTGQLIRLNREADRQRRIAEIEALKSRINPHFLYNTLETIRMQAVLHDEPEIAKGVSSLGKMLRYSIGGAGDFVPLEREMENATNYVFLQKMRYQDKFQVKMQFQPGSMECLVPRLIVQPIVENALQHGIEKKCGQALLCVRTELHADRLCICVQDDGVGIAPERLAELRSQLQAGYARGRNKHIGMHNVHSRLQLYFGSEYGVEIESRPGEGTTVRLWMPALHSIEEIPNRQDVILPKEES